MKSELDIHLEKDFAREMAILASTYSGTMKELTDGMTLCEVFELTQSLYKTEEGEIIMLPQLFYEAGGDCDDQAIFISSFLLSRNVSADDIYYAFMSFDRQPGEDHVCVILKTAEGILVLDPVPGNKFGQISDYDDLRLYRLSRWVK